MKEKKWVFFRVMVYMCIAGAALALAIIFYYSSIEFRNITSVETIVIVFVTALLLQIAFNFMNVRLIHYHLFNKALPERNFSVWHTILIIINCVIALGLTALFIFGTIETFNRYSRHHRFDTGDVMGMVIVGAYTSVTVITITGAIRLRNYLKKYTIAYEEEWLQQLGS